MGSISKLKDQRGSTYIDVVIGFFICCIVLALIIQVLPALIQKYELGSFANDVSRIISVTGSYNDEARNAIEECRLANGIGEVDISLDGTQYISGTDRIQLNDLIMVEVTATYDLGFFSFGSFPITLTNKAESRSEVYWK